VKHTKNNNSHSIAVVAQPGTAQTSDKEGVSLEILFPRKYHRACFSNDFPVQIRATAYIFLEA